jgi:hypothetical protein
MKARTPAEQQMEELRRMRETLAKRRPTEPGKAKPAGGLDPSGTREASKSKKPGPSLALGKALYRQLLERQRKDKAFKRRRDMGDWAAQLLLALPSEAHKLSPEAKADLFKRMQEWAQARGLQ